MMSGEVTYSIIIPVYNNQETLELLYQQLVEVFEKKIQTSFELLFVEDDSQDDSWPLLNQLKDQDDRIRLIKLKKNIGQHQATLLGLHYSHGQQCISIDADGQIFPSEIIKLIEEETEQDQVIIGAFTRKKHSWIANRGSFFVDLLLRWLYGKPSDLVISSFKLFKRSAVEKLTPFLGKQGYLAAFILQVIPLDAIRNVYGIQHHFSKHTSSYSWIGRLKLIAILLHQASGCSVVNIDIDIECEC